MLKSMVGKLWFSTFFEKNRNSYHHYSYLGQIFDHNHDYSIVTDFHLPFLLKNVINYDIYITVNN